MLRGAVFSWTQCISMVASHSRLVTQTFSRCAAQTGALALVCRCTFQRSRDSSSDRGLPRTTANLARLSSPATVDTVSADIPCRWLSGNLRHHRQEISLVRSHWDAICTQNNDHAGDEKFRGCWPSHLQQFTSRSANCNSLPSDVRSTFEGRQWRI